jgi:hypothetical protein
MPEHLRSVAETLAVLAGWTVFAGAILRYFLLRWVQQREEFEKWCRDGSGALNERIENYRRESVDARDVLRRHVDHEDGVIRERNHDLAGKLGVLTNEQANLKNDILVAIEANKEVMEWANTKFDELTKQFHALDKTISNLTAVLSKSLHQNGG